MDTQAAQRVAHDGGADLFGVCPFVTSQSILQGKWAILILHHLAEGPLRFNELIRRMDVAQGTLSKQLKNLEHEGLVRRTVHTDGPLRVEYELTDIGLKFRGVLDAIEAWGNDYIEFLRTHDGDDVR